MFMVRRISIAFLEFADSSSSSSGQGISKIIDSEVVIGDFQFIFSNYNCQLHAFYSLGFPVKENQPPPLLRIFWKTSWGVLSLKGGTPVRNSKRHTPSAHQSTMKSGWGQRKVTSYSRWLRTPQFSLWFLLESALKCTAVAEAGTELDWGWRDSTSGNKHSFIHTR